MSKYIPISDVMKYMKMNRISTWIDKLSFYHIFLMWLLIIASFGVFFYSFSNDNHYLLYASKTEDSPNALHVSRVQDCIYYSFVTATTTGFGDILPVGFFKVLSVMEVICGLMLVALVTSKLVSIKQDVILNEMYDFSIMEKISKVRSSLLLFRQNLGAITNSIEDGTMKKRDVAGINIYLASLEDSLNEIYRLLSRKEGKNDFVKSLDPINAELIFNSVINSYEKLHDLIILMNSKKIEWATDLNKDLITRCFSVTDILFRKLDEIENLRKDAVKDLNMKKDKSISNIREQIIAMAKEKQDSAKTKS